MYAVSFKITDNVSWLGVSWGGVRPILINKPKTLKMTKLNKQTQDPQLRQTAVGSSFFIY